MKDQALVKLIMNMASWLFRLTPVDDSETLRMAYFVRIEAYLNLIKNLKAEKQKGENRNRGVTNKICWPMNN